MFIRAATTYVWSCPDCGKELTFADYRPHFVVCCGKVHDLPVARPVPNAFAGIFDGVFG